MIERPSELALDDTPTLPVIQHTLKHVKPNVDAVITLQPTSPLRTSVHINESISNFLKKTQKRIA